MPLQSQTLIEETTSVVASVVGTGVAITQDMTPATLFVTNLAGVEEVDIFISQDAGLTFQASAQDGSLVTMSLLNNTLSINSPMRIGVTKDATVSASGVFLFYHIKV